MQIIPNSQVVQLGLDTLGKSDALRVLAAPSPAVLGDPGSGNATPTTYPQAAAWIATDNGVALGLRSVDWIKITHTSPTSDTWSVWLHRITITDPTAGIAQQQNNDSGPVDAAISTVDIDWGDGSTVYSTSTPAADGTQFHAYAAPGNYTIAVTVALVAPSSGYLLTNDALRFVRVVNVP